MQILAHRGFWNDKVLRNSPAAIKAALENGFGFESDVRDYRGRMVISHDIADDSCQDAEEVFQWLAAHGDRACFAINVKADGLKDMLKEKLERYAIKNYFLFDMSVPQMVEYSEAGLRFFTRQSEYEEQPTMYQQAAGIWMDGFESMDWVTEELLKSHMGLGKEVCLVSPELHKRTDRRQFWERLGSWDIDRSKVLLCTDCPDEARRFFRMHSRRRE